MQKNGFHKNVSYNSFALSPRSDVHALIYFILKNKKGLDFSRQIKRHSVHNNLGLIIVVMIVVRSAVAQW